VALALLLVLLALSLTLPRLTTPVEYVFDELYYAFTAGNYVAGNEAYNSRIPPTEDPAIEWTHPPLAKLWIAGGILVAGDSAVGWRLPSVLLSVAGVLVTFFLGLSLTGSRAASALAAALLLFDGVYFIESRLGMSNLLVLVTTAGALLGLSRVLTAPPERIARPLLATGVMLGLALATKWSAAALLGLTWLAICWRVIDLWRRDQDAAGREAILPFLLWTPVAMALVPAAVYLASFSHFFLTGHDWANFVALHRDMLTYHRELGVVHSNSSWWWEWPLALRPVWYYVNEGLETGSYIIANGNLLLYWPMVVAVLWLAIDWWGRRPAALWVLLIGFFGQWLPWALSPRGTFIYHFLPAVPFGCIALAWLLTGAWNRGGFWRAGAVLYVLAVVATFAFFYPVYTAMPLTPDQLELRLWLDSWR
jgi:dolichyl-phosphate-mannose--protein O-mannosyl transferase